MGNLGKARIKATVGGKMKGMLSDSWRSINDITATDAYQHFQGAAQGSSSSVEFVQDPVSGGCMAMPARRHEQVANYVSGITSTATMASPRIVWSVLTKGTDADLSGCVGSDRIGNLITNKGLKIDAPSSSGSTRYLDSYVGPRWSTPRGPKRVLRTPSDAPPADAGGAPAQTTPDTYSRAYISQDSACQDVWWSIETTSMSPQAQIGTPFYVEVCFSRPLASKQTTFFALRIGSLYASSTSARAGGVQSQAKEAFELLFIDGVQNAILYDLGMWEEKKEKDANGQERTVTVPVEVALPGTIAWDGSFHKIEFIPLAGSLLIWIDNKWSFLYTRVDRSASTSTSSTNTGIANGALTKGSLLFFPKYDQIRAIGSNSQATMMLGQVCFPERATLQTNLTAAYDPATGANTASLQGSTDGLPVTTGTPVPLVALPGVTRSGTGASATDTQSVILGAFAARYVDRTGASPSVALSGGDFWGSAAKGMMHGTVEFGLEDDKTGSPMPNAKLGKHYTITMVSDKGAFGEGEVEEGTASDGQKKPNLCPVWFRARGAKSVPLNGEMESQERDVSAYVMEVSDSFTSPDRYHITHSLDIVLYNESGRFDGLAEKSYPIRVGFRWSGPDDDAEVETMIFTGIVLNGSKSLVAGKETITLHCEDYMFILEATLVINSPYYDGMDGFNIVRDMAAKANLKVIDETGNGPMERFFVPSEYSFLEPAKRYDPKSSAKECILDVCSMGSKIVWFDGDGVMHYDSIQGGIGFSRPPEQINVDPDMAFVSDPAAATADNLIVLEEKRTEVKLNSVVNHIFIKAIDRTTRAIIFASAQAEAETNLLPYKKVMYYSVPSLGSFAAVMEMLERLKTRVYKPIRGITIKVASAAPFLPMSFFSVDGEKFRLMGVNRAVRIEDNSITASLTGEWMGATQGATKGATKGGG